MIDMITVLFIQTKRFLHPFPPLSSISSYPLPSSPSGRNLWNLSLSLVQFDRLVQKEIDFEHYIVYIL